jgi:hypothetical protein
MLEKLILERNKTINYLNNLKGLENKEVQTILDPQENESDMSTVSAPSMIRKSSSVMSQELNELLDNLESRSSTPLSDATAKPVDRYHYPSNPVERSDSNTTEMLGNIEQGGETFDRYFTDDTV